ncbi:MAG: NAD(P)H-binding protein [Firmicutes bacterium]|nr:NAD(P)H-binding protein [Bacillota bacterium]
MTAVVITGAAGFLGRHLADGLLAAGSRVVGVVRPGTARRLRFPAANAQVVEADLRFPLDRLAEALAGADAVIHAAALRRERPRRGETYEAVHVEGTARLATAARWAGVKRIVLISCLGTAAAFDSPYLRSKAEAERVVAASGLRWTILRCGLIYGPGDGRITRLARWMRWTGRAPVVEDGRFPVQPIAVGDVVAGCVRAAAGDLDNQILAAAGPDVLSYADMIDLVAAALDRRLPRLRVSLSLTRVLGGLGRAVGMVPWTADELEVMMRGQTCDPSAYFRAAGVDRPLPFSAAVRLYLPV